MEISSFIFQDQIVQQPGSPVMSPEEGDAEQSMYRKSEERRADSICAKMAFAANE